MRNMPNDVCWVAMQSVFGYGSSRAIEVLQYFDNLNDFFKADESKIKAMRLLTPAELVRLKKVDFSEAESIVKHCEQKGYKILTPQSEDYPKRLLRIKNPPCVLYVCGNLPNIDDEPVLAMVGTRNCTKNGLIVGSVLSYRLAEAGAIIVSGGAVGIDTACSRGAVAVNKPSIIVLGCGLDYPYLLKNRKIRDDVEANGAIISEFPPNTPPSKTTFPMRNRIMSALSLGVVLIEAPEKSGALITVSCALEQGKDVFVLPGDITNKNYVGNNHLLQEGASAVYTPKDILSEYAAEYPHKLFLRNADIPLAEDRLFINMYNKNRNVPNDRFMHGTRGKTYAKRKNDDTAAQSVKRAAQKPAKYADNIADKHNDEKAVSVLSLPDLHFDADESVKKVYNCFTNRAATVDILIQKSGLPANDVLFALTELEMNGAIDALPGGMYQVPQK